MRNPLTLFGALGFGAGLMYFLDPNRGKRRRALFRDRTARLTKDINRQLTKKAADVRNRARGIWFETEKLFEHENVTDEQLEARVRTRLGRLTTHPHAVKTSVKDGKVALSGPILTDEVETLLRGLASVGGLKELENNLDAHDSAEHVSALQGSERADAVERRQKEWSSPKRFLAAAAGSGLALFGTKNRTAAGSLLASLGVGLLARSAINKPISKLLTSTNGKKNITVRKTITIDAPPEKVFEAVKYPQYFPYFMSHVRRVEPAGDGRYRWTVDGIAGFPVKWETEVTNIVENERIEWKSADGETIEQTGRLYLEPADDGAATRLHVDLDYHPVGGALGHFVAGLFSRDPKSEMDDDLLRLKTYLEKGILPRDAAAEVNSKGSKEMKVKEIMTKDPASATLETSLHDVAQMMTDNDCGCIPVTENERSRKPIGVITDRDITLRTVAHNKNPLNMIAGEVMTDSVITVKPEMSVEECLAAMENNQIRRVPVVDDEGNLCGIVAQADVARQAPPFETAELVRDVSAESRAFVRRA